MTVQFTVNGAPLALDDTEGKSLGQLLADAENRIDKEGSVIVALKVDGEEVDAENYARFAEQIASSVGSVDIRAEDAAAIKVRAIGTILELLAIAKRSSEDGAEAISDWPGLRASSRDIRDAFASLFTAEELSFAQLFADILGRAGDEPDKASRVEISAQADALASVFRERLAELTSPISEMRTAAALFDERSSDLSELPVLLQTGKEGQAMKAVLYFIEVFNKVIRIIQGLRRSGIDAASISVEGSSIPDFYGAFNDVLREMTDAIEHNDTVLIGDLAEYEILPRMRSFFAAMREALPES